MSDDPVSIVLAAMRGVEAHQVAIERESLTGEVTAKVSLRIEQLEEALRENGRYVRQAAVASGIRIQVELAKDEKG
jgi:transcription antitermination factor NusA-like protein